MSAVQNFELPAALKPEIALACVEQLDALPNAACYRLDVGHLQHLEVFGCLLVASAIRRLRHRQYGEVSSRLELDGINLDKQGHQVARNWGFWKSIGITGLDPKPGTEASSQFVRITRLGIDELYREAGGYDPVRSETVLRHAQRLAKALCVGAEDNDLRTALVYSISEMLRNAVEHSRAQDIWIAASARRGDERRPPEVQVAILDEGRGVRASLAENQLYRRNTDLEALRLALEPRVSRSAGRNRTGEQLERLLDQFPGQDPTYYDNHGFGLALTSSIAKRAGKFLIASGASSLALFGGAEVVAHTSHPGTAIQIVLYPQKLSGVMDRVRAENRERERLRGGSGALISASMMARLGVTTPRPEDGSVQASLIPKHSCGCNPRSSTAATGSGIGHGIVAVARRFQ